jgi:ATP-dependent Clp protease ATP-binding subunit ClpA
MSSIAQQLAARVIGQQAAIDAIAPVIRLWEAGLNPIGRPAGVFMFLGPTGTGKTRTVEALAEIVVGNPKACIRVDCAEFQHSHEIAKLLGSPAGYLGHRETHPMLSQEVLNQYHTDKAKLSFVLFDEIEKASDSLSNLLLGILDKGTLTLGDNRKVDFTRTMVFCTSNIGADAMARSVRAPVGFSRPVDVRSTEKIALSAAKKKWTPEFLNRIDAIVCYKPLSQESITEILDLELGELRRHINTSLGIRAFPVAVDNAAKRALIAEGISPEYGARELKRVIQRRIMQPIAALIAGDQNMLNHMVRVTAPKGDVCVELDWRYNIGAA